MKSLLISAAFIALWACQPTILPKSVTQALIGSWRVEYIRTQDQTSAFFSRTHFCPLTQPDLMAVTLTFQPDGHCAIATTTGQRTGTWQASPQKGIIDIELASRYRLTDVRREGNVLTFQSADLTSFLGGATYTLHRQDN